MAWRTVTIGDYLVRTELRDPRKRPRDRFFYVDVSSVDNQAFAIRQATELLGADAPSRARKVIRERDVLFATVRPTLRRIALVDSALDNQICSTGFCVLRTSTKLDAEFLYYWLLTDEVVEHAAKIEKGVSYPAIRDSDVKAIRMPYPPLAEQRQIAAVLSAVQRATERQERLITLTAELKKALLHKLFTEGTRGEPLKQTEIGPVPKSWEIVRLDHLATIERGRFTHRPRNAPEFYGGNIPFVQTGDVSRCDGRIRSYTQTLNERGLAISRMFPRGTILITIAANIGYAGILEFDSACTDSLVAITPTRGDSAEFLNHYLQTQQSVMDRLAPQGTQKNINIQFLKPWPTPRPSTDEQTIISDALNKVDVKRRTHERVRDSLISLFGTLLDQLMTAQIRVHDLDLSALEEAERESVGAV